MVVVRSGSIRERVERQVEFTRATRGYSVLAFMTLDGIIGHTITHASVVTAEKFTYDITPFFAFSTSF